MVGIDRTTHYKWLKADEVYTAAFKEARDMGGDVLEDEAVRRAHDGVDEPVFYQGEVCGVVRKYSDSVLMFLLKGAKPDKYKDRAEVTGKDNGPLLVHYVNDWRNAE
jgi:hypothetical protein